MPTLVERPPPEAKTPSGAPVARSVLATVEVNNVVTYSSPSEPLARLIVEPPCGTEYTVAPEVPSIRVTLPVVKLATKRSFVASADWQSDGKLNNETAARIAAME